MKVLTRGQHKADKLEHVVWVLGAPGEVEIVRWIFEQYAMGNGLRSIVNELNRRKVPSPYNKDWAKSTVRSILLNPAYLGRRVYFKRAYHERGPDARKHIRPRDEWIETPTAHPAIITQELFDKVQSRFRIRKMGEGRRHVNGPVRARRPGPCRRRGWA